MDERALFTQFWIKESATTRRVLERIPEGSSYRPDPRSRTAQEIAWQIVGEERLIIDALETGRVAWRPAPMPATMAEVLAAYDAHSAGMGDRWRALPYERWAGTLEMAGRERSASAMAWSFLFDIVHHRGQITTYLRPMGSTVPQVYGPSADEP
jgi:uncharacterized damage-inducible protein DinB